mgnify:CR=1 FL=1
MLRFFAGVASALLLVATGFFVWQGLAQQEENPVPPPPAAGAPGPFASKSNDESSFWVAPIVIRQVVTLAPPTTS